MRALEEIYTHYAPALARTLRGGFAFDWDGKQGLFRGYGLPFELADALQEVFARAFSEASRLGYDGLNPFAAYLAGIAHNIAVDHLRKRRTAAAALGTLSESFGPESSPAPDIAAEEAEAGRLLTSFVTTLDERERPLYQARFIDRLTQDAAASALGLSRIQVRRAELKLRRALLEHLKRNGYLEDTRITGWGLAESRPALPGRRRDP